LDLVDHDFHHLLTDESLLRVLGIASGFDLTGSSAGETNAEESKKVAIGGLSLDEGLNEGVPLLDEGAKLVLSDVDAVEVGVAVVALHFLYLHLNLSPGLSTACSVQISQRYFKHSALQAISGVLLTSSLIDWCDSRNTDVKDGGDVHIVPFLFGKGMLDLLLLSLLFEVSGVLSCSHFDR